MASVRQPKVIWALLALAAIITNAHVWGGADKAAPKTSRLEKATADEQASQELVPAKFANGSAITYRTTQGETLFALQIKPKLEPIPTRARDILIMVDTSASQAKGPLECAASVAQQMISQSNATDRVSIWTANIPGATNDLTRGFKPLGARQVQEALVSLRKELPMGDTDLKDAISRALGTFDDSPSRQRLILFLGDGMSIHNPLSANDRASLCASLVNKGVQFLAVPLGPNIDSSNLRGLSTGTGGSFFAVDSVVKPEVLTRDILANIAVPVLYPKSCDLGKNVAEVVPSVLPPLRGDTATLLVGKMNAGQNISYSIEGLVGDKSVKLEGVEELPAPAMDNYFLIGTFEQWKTSKEAPALASADKALAYAYMQGETARAEFHSKAEWAMSKNNWEAATAFYQEAKKLDPSDLEADAGIRMIEKLRTGIVNRETIREQLKRTEAKPMTRVAKGTTQTATQTPVIPPASADDLLQDQKRRIAIEEQRMRQVVSDAQNQAARILGQDPDAAHDILKRAYASVRENPDLGDQERQSLMSRLQESLRAVDLNAGRIKRDQDERLRALADSQRTRDLLEARTIEEERMRRRFQQFANLMSQARFDEAYAQSLAIIRDAVSNGQTVPTAAIAAYYVGLTSHNLAQVREIKRLSEDYFLRAMLQVELSHIPFPDESPVVFPPESAWREISKRIEKYQDQSFTTQDPETLRKLRALKAKLELPVNLEKAIEKRPLSEVIEFFTDRFDFPIIVNEPAFKADASNDNVMATEVSLPKMAGVSLATVLRLLTSQFGGTFLVRRDYVEFTTPTRAIAEKVVRVYPVADLVIPIPNAFNVQAVSQQLTILGTSPGIGLQLGSPAVLGQLGQGLGFGGGAVGVVGIGVSGLGLGGGVGFGGVPGGLGISGALGALGFAGVPGAGGGLGTAGQQPVNLGAGGGALGFGGGQLGQLGNLGGQFGLQGGNQSQVLIQLIRDVVGNTNEWQIPGVFQRPGAGAINPAGGQGADDEDADRLPATQLNSLGFYPPANALVVKGTSRFHSNLGSDISKIGPGGNFQGANPRKRDLDRIRQIANAGQNKQDKTVARRAGADAMPEAPPEPTQVLQEILEKSRKDPGLLVAAAELLSKEKRFDYVADLLKACVHKGVIVKPWVYEALALALESSGGAPVEIERARVSAVDLVPTDAAGYLRASKAMADQKRYDRAVAYCKQAALIDPTSAGPYEEALVYAGMGKDPTAMEWAAGSLLKRDWPIDNQDLHQKARGKLNDLFKSLETSSRKPEAERMLGSVANLEQRDLVINLTWQGQADLDLEVEEPIGTLCSFLQRQSPGGGVLLGDTVSEDTRETYVAAKAFKGDYKVTLRRIWGRPQGGKAVVEIIQYQGTPDEIRRRETVVFDRSHTMTVSLAAGRRTTAEYVPPTTPRKETKKLPALASNADIMNKLRELAHSDSKRSDVGVRGGFNAAESAIDPAASNALTDNVPLLYQTKVGAGTSAGVDVVAQVSVDPDRSNMRIKYKPVFQGMKAGSNQPGLVNPLIPGGFDGDRP